ncbi:MAG: GNAT family N-acetyltransferase, partial [Thermoplasmata archaeon]
VRTHLAEHSWLFTQGSPRPRRVDWPEATAIGSAVPSELTNTLFVRKRVADARRLIADAQQYFGRSAAWRVLAPSELSEGLDPAALAAGLHPGATAPLLILRPIPPSPALPPGLTIRPVREERTLRDFCAAGGRGFRIPAWMLRVAIPKAPTPSSREEATVCLRVGYVGGRPVATSAAVSKDGLVGVFFVTTVPEARRRGYGAALTSAAIEDGRRAGAEASYLHATAMGRPVYEQMGFRWAEDYLEWLPTVSGFGQLRALLRMFGLALRRPRPTRDPSS